MTTSSIFVTFVSMKNLEKWLFRLSILLLIVCSFLCGAVCEKYGNGRGNSDVQMVHYLEVTFPQMEKTNGTH